MPQIFTSHASEAKVNGETVDGLQSIEYREIKNRYDVGAIGHDERIAVYYGLKVVIGKLRVASANTTLDGLLDSGEEFSISATLKHGDNTRTAAFRGCRMDEKTFALSTEAHGETIYTFTATALQEE
jgi:hypothetical protein